MQTRLNNSSFFSTLSQTLLTPVLALASLGVAQGAAQAAPLKAKVGIFLPMSGGTATFGEETNSGIQMAVQEINAQGKVKLELVLEDEKSEVTDSANAVKKLINVDKVDIVLGSVASSNTSAAAPIAQTAKVPLLTPASTNPDVTKKGEYISRICFIDDFQGLAMAKFAIDTLGAKTAALVTDSSSDYSIGLAKAFKDAFVERGGKITVEVSYQQKDQDFSSQLTRVRVKKPDVVFAPGYYTEIGNMIRQAKKMGVKNAKGVQTPFLGGDGWSSPKLYELGGDAIVGHYYSDHFSEEDTDPTVQDFVKRYQKKFKIIPGAMAALGYDSAYVVADAIIRAGGANDREKLMKAINSTKGLKGVTGVISLDQNRNASKPLVILETQRTRAAFKQRVAP
jgi:branched-chain amino acid transport system substrate-binding protein